MPPHLGYVSWRPYGKTQPLLHDVRAILEDYVDYLPLAIRQIFYILVGRGYVKSDRFYKRRLIPLMGRARRARIIDWDDIRDDTVTVMEGQFYKDEDDFWEQVRQRAKSFQLDKQTRQPVAIEVHCEAAGMMPQVYEMVRRYSIPVYSSSGFHHLPYKRSLVDRIAARYEKGTVVLYLGDWDKPGEDMFANFQADIRAFLEEDGHPITPDPIFEKVALTGEQVREYHLPTAPEETKKKTKRKLWRETTQLESLPPDILARLLEEAVFRHWDTRIYQQDVKDDPRKRRMVQRALPATTER
jgi:hypothetical protein